MIPLLANDCKRILIMQEILEDSSLVNETTFGYVCTLLGDDTVLSLDNLVGKDIYCFMFQIN